MSEKMFKLLRTLQWLIPALCTFYGVLDSVFGWQTFGAVETIVSALVALIGTIAQHSSDQYFSDKEIVTKE